MAEREHCSCMGMGPKYIMAEDRPINEVQGGGKVFDEGWQKITMAVDSENNKIHFYLNGRESDARLVTGTQSPLSFSEPLKKYGMEPFNVGYSKSPVEEFFKGGIASIQMWDRCLTSDEVKNLHKEIPEDNLILDIFTMNLEFGEMENIWGTSPASQLHWSCQHKREGTVSTTSQLHRSWQHKRESTVSTSMHNY